MNLRLLEHPILTFKRGKPVNIFFNGKKILAHEGETISAALYANGIKTFKRSIKLNRPRGFFCSIGKCSSCLMRVDGIPNVRTCITPVKDGIRVDQQRGRGEIPPITDMKFEKEKMETELTVIGAGPAGLSAAITALSLGIDTLIVDENSTAGGQLIKQTHKFFGLEETFAGMRGFEIAKILLKKLEKSKMKWLLNASVVGIYNGKKPILAVVQENRKLIEVKTKYLIVATGAMENHLAFPNNDIPGVYGAGAVQTIMNVYGIKPGENALVVGAGNVGLILAYQLLQAGVKVKAVVEAMPRIGGYLVHASKIRRMGIPILTSHTIREAIGKEHVKKAVIVKLDERWQEVEGSEKEFDVDLICLAVGLSPSCELLFQAGCEKAYIPELGGNVALHDRELRTTREEMYVAGDASGIEEASTAMVEGEIAAASIASSKKISKKAEKIKEDSLKKLELLRSSPFSEKVKKGKEKVWSLMREMKG